MSNRKKGRLEKKYWEQVIAVFPQLRDMVKRYEESFSVEIQGEIEDSLSMVESYLTKPRRCGENGMIMRGIVKTFVTSAAARLYSSSQQDQAKAFILSRIASSYLIIILSGDSSDHGEHQ